MKRISWAPPNMSAQMLGTLPDARSARSGAATSRALRALGINVDLAPVEDTVPSPAAARRNPPIGVYDREFGYNVRVVAHHGLAFLRGMSDRGVAATLKHFPGLGRVSGNPDTAAGVTDAVRDAVEAPA